MLTLALFSQCLSTEEKAQLVLTMRADHGEHLLESLPNGIEDLHISRAFFKTAGIDDSFLDQPVDAWSDTESFKKAADLVKNLSCVNDCAERGIALIQSFNATITHDETQKQYLLQVVEKHRKDFAKCN